MTYHVLGLTHLPVNDQYRGCAYTMKTWKLCKMLMNAGHTVYLYGVENSNAPCTEFIKVLDLKDIRREYGDGDNRWELGYSWKTTMFRHNFDPPYNAASNKFFANAITEINKRKKDDDFLLCTMGQNNKPISDAVGLFLTCEPGIGYRGSFAKYKCFESSYLQNYTYGWWNNGESANGNNYDVVIPNYFDPADFVFQPKKEDYFLYIGRMIQRKGILTAIETCKKIGKKLVLAGQGGKVVGGRLYGDDFDVPYENMEYIGFLDKEKRTEIMGKAKACFVATDYLEPFGGVSIESLLSGTPVITTNFGCFPETIPHGEVGYRCQTLDQFVWAAKNIDKIDPKRCREYAEKNFSLDRISKKYSEWFESLYHLYLSAQGKPQEGWYFVDKNRKDLDWLRVY